MHQHRRRTCDAEITDIYNAETVYKRFGKIRRLADPAFSAEIAKMPFEEKGINNTYEDHSACQAQGDQNQHRHKEATLSGPHSLF